MKRRRVFHDSDLYCLNQPKNEHPNKFEQQASDLPPTAKENSNFTLHFTEKERKMCGGGGRDDDDGCRCRPLGFLLGLPFALVAVLISIVGVLVWIVGLTLSCICPCCLCVTVLIEIALELIKAPFHVMEWFFRQIPC